MSTREIGEGHRSSIGFRAASVDGRGQVTVQPTGPYSGTGTISAATLPAEAFRRLARRVPDDVEATAWVLAALGDQFTPAELDRSLVSIGAQAQHQPQPT